MDFRVKIGGDLLSRQTSPNLICSRIRERSWADNSACKCPHHHLCPASLWNSDGEWILHPYNDKEVAMALSPGQHYLQSHSFCLILCHIDRSVETFEIGAKMKILKLNGWYWKIVRHSFYVSQICVHYFIVICEFKLESSGNSKIWSKCIPTSGTLSFDLQSQSYLLATKMAYDISLHSVPEGLVRPYGDVNISSGDGLFSVKPLSVWVVFFTSRDDMQLNLKRD